MVLIKETVEKILAIIQMEANNEAYLQKEGKLREAFKKQDQYLNLYIMAILKREYEQLNL